MSVHQLQPRELSTFLDQHPDAFLLDVRQPWEHEVAAIENSFLIPLGELPVRAELELPEKETPIVIYCHHGIRSMQAVVFLASLGYSDLYNLAGGIDRYSSEVDASVPAY